MKNGCNVTQYPAQVLRKKTRCVPKINDETRGILLKLVDTMRENEGIGLAAPQIGIDLQLAVVDSGSGIIKLANPIIVAKKGSDTMNEGCLSVPSFLVRVKRAKIITIEYMDERGETIKKTFDGLTAKAIQHEIDHLRGRLIIDYLPWYKRLFASKKLKRT